MKKICCVLATVIMLVCAWAVAESAYTVDFYFGDAEYHVLGGSDVALSDLFDELNIDREISTVLDVTFSDESLIEVDTDWILHTLKAFNTTETLRVEFIDGESIEIRVEDDNYFSVAISPEGAGTVTASAFSIKPNGTNDKTLNVKANSGYLFDHWEVDGENATIKDPKKITTTTNGQKVEGGGIYIGDSAGHTLTAVFKRIEPFTFTVTSTNPAQGTVSGINSTGSNQTYVPSYTATTNMESKTKGYNNTTIVANGNSGYKFDHWELKDGNTVVKTYTSRQLGAGSLEITKNGLTLEAYFTQAASGDTPDPLNVDDLIQQWKEEMTEQFTVDKTAHVVNYENRIYEVDLSTSSVYKMIYPAVSINFITDTSRSMYFPATVNEVGRYGSGTSTSTIQKWFDKKTSDADRAQTYFFIGDQNGTATMYAVYYENNGWNYVDASYYRAPDGATATVYPLSVIPTSGTDANKTQDPSKRLIEPIIYTSQEREDAWKIGYRNEEGTRLYYLKQALYAAAEVIFALNPDARIGLTTFNATATDEGSFSDLSSFNKALSTIAPSGGTRQDLGLSTAAAFFDSGKAENNGHQYAAVLITDGAPQPPSGGTPNVETIWTYIENNAKELKKLSNANKNLVLYTLGLSLSKVGKNKANLEEKVASPGKAKNAETSSATITAIEQIVEDLVDNITLYGSLTDTLDPVFYPVDNDGNPIAAGLYSAKGEPIDSAPEGNTPYYEWTCTNGIWSITWHNQQFPWPDEKTEVPGWSQSFHVKTKEDYLGGNTIKTNSGDDKVTATGYVSTVDGSITDFPEPFSNNFDTPYVNIDELALTGNETEWTVYVDTTTTPLDQVKKLFEEIDVREVVSGSTNHEITTKDQMLDGTSEESETFKLSSVVELTEEDWEKLVKGETVTVKYSAYGHESGVVELKLTGNNPDEHDLEGDETYTLTAVYKPDPPQSVDYHTTPTKEPGAPTGEMISTNTHKLHIIQTGLRINKVDESGNALSGVTFAVYRAEETGAAVDGLPEGTYVSAGEASVEGNVITFNPVYPVKDENGVYPAGDTTLYLIETDVPAGYKKLDKPIEVKLTITETKDPETAETVEAAEDEQEPLLVSWIQTASIALDSEMDDVEMVSDTENILVLRITNRPPSVKITVSGEKKVLPDSVELEDGQFTFILQPSTVEGTALSGEAAEAYPGFTGASLTVTNDAKGVFTFSDLVFTLADYDKHKVDGAATFYYLVTEDRTNALSTYRYDESKFLVTVTLSIEDGELVGEMEARKLTTSD